MTSERASEREKERKRERERVREQVRERKTKTSLRLSLQLLQLSSSSLASSPPNDVFPPASPGVKGWNTKQTQEEHHHTNQRTNTLPHTHTHPSHPPYPTHPSPCLPHAASSPQQSLPLFPPFYPVNPRHTAPIFTPRLTHCSPLTPACA